MRISTLLARNLKWYWRTNLAVLLGVATAAAVLGGALLVGDSVRASLRDLVLARLGNTQYVVSRNGFFRDQLARSFASASPAIVMNGMVAHQPSGRRALGVEIYGMENLSGSARLSSALARELGAKPGDALLIRVEKPSAIPLESLHGRKEDVGKTIRLTLSADAAPDFSLSPQQGDVRAAYVPLARLQRELGEAGKVNTLLLAAPPPRDLSFVTLDDLGIKLRNSAVETDTTYIPDALADRVIATAKALGLTTEPVFTYLANSIRANGREIPYSVVTALTMPPAPAADDSITLNAWAARDLQAKPGDSVTLEYYAWKSDGRLHTETAQFRLAQIVPIAGAAADRDYAPEYPGITESNSLHDWDPPFPLDLHRVRPADEQYWKQYRTTPKAFIALARGQQLWGTRFGKLTSIRISPPSPAFAGALRAALDPAQMGLAVIPVRARNLQASQGATDFGEYFVYFSFFLMVSALLLTGLFFKLGVEQRLHEIGVLRALGFSIARIRSVFLLEGAVLSLAGALLGLAGALAYGELIMLGLRTWWIGAVGTRLITLHPSIASLAAGAAAGIVTGLGVIVWTLRKLAPVTPRGLLTGETKHGSAKRPMLVGIAAGVLACVLLAAALLRAMDQTAAFFGAGTLFLIAALALQSALLNRRKSATIGGLTTLALRNAAYRPGRSILCIAQIACAVFLIVSVDAFRQTGNSAGTGGYPLMAESVMPLIYDPNTAAGRDALNLPALPGVQFVPFRLRPGDDTSCLNLYQPRNPRILGAPPAFLHSAHFEFQDSVPHTANPWLLLEAPLPGGVIPAIADANSMTYVLHLKLGEDFVLNQTRFRIVAALEDSLFQSELLISESNFLRLFPDVEGYRFFLLNTSPERAPQVTGTLEEALSDYGFDIQSTAARLAGFHKVENTYLSTFRSLGALGLVLGTVGLAAILLRNVLERRRELALLRAVGYRPSHLAAIVLGENLLLLLLGLATGTLCALLAITPAISLRGGRLPIASLSLLLAAVLVTGIAASLAATRAALRSPLLAALRSE
ncbi:MAG TPA: ABC transporter permease [Bryobacteraceae bacterium]|jgi:ABC-type lipoprotein release transport system permease subunit|nr:ABC transporter permease [Bryobacteraceae bacterium]